MNLHGLKLRRKNISRVHRYLLRRDRFVSNRANKIKKIREALAQINQKIRKLRESKPKK